MIKIIKIIDGWKSINTQYRSVKGGLMGDNRR